jgi:hypothetical protein
MWSPSRSNEADDASLLASLVPQLDSAVFRLRRGQVHGSTAAAVEVARLLEKCATASAAGDFTFGNIFNGFIHIGTKLLDADPTFIVIANVVSRALRTVIDEANRAVGGGGEVAAIAPPTPLGYRELARAALEAETVSSSDDASLRFRLSEAAASSAVSKRAAAAIADGLLELIEEAENLDAGANQTKAYS